MLPVASGVDAAVIAVPSAPRASAVSGAADRSVIHKRDKVVLEVTVGQTHVERQATALQNAREGEMLFVRTADGEVIAVRAGEKR